MKTILNTVAIFFAVLMNAQSNPEQKKILMVVSSYGKDLGATRPGYEFDEFSQAFAIFKNNNLAIDVASPKGGNVEADKFNKEKPYNNVVLQDSEAMALLNNTQPTPSINPAEYDAIYIVGGKGAMFDLPYDSALQDIILNMYQREGTVIASVCHGPAVFANVKDGDNFIINDIEITGFSNIEEDLFSKKWVKEFPFKLEDKIVSRGANFSKTDFMLSHVSVSGKFVTGQNPYSTTRSAEEVVKALGLTPVNRALYNDERSVYLIQDVLDNTKTVEWVKQELEQNKDIYDFPLMASYGYYKMMASEDNKEQLKKGIELTELVTPHFFHERIEMVLAESYIQIDEIQKAKTILKNLRSKNLLKEEVETLLKDIEKI